MFGINNKKGAMFGKLSQLDHINLFGNKKGAMFGLDARIALAIFGALSVISGAALYSAIQESKITSIMTELEELAKAYEAYVLDTGTQIEVSSHGAGHGLVTEEIVRSSKPGWKGPYISEESGFNNDNLMHSYKYQYIFYGRYTTESSFGSYTNSTASQKTCIGNKLECHNWVAFYNVGSIDIAKALDLMVDGAIAANDGRLRVRFHSSNKYAVYYQIMPDLVPD